MYKVRNIAMSVGLVGALIGTAFAYGYENEPIIPTPPAQVEVVEETVPDVIYLEYIVPPIETVPVEPMALFHDVEEDIPEEEQVEEETETVPEPEEDEPIVTEPEPENDISIDERDIELLACVIYQEAGSDYICDDCRRYVADVVLNRVEDPRFPNTIEEVLTQDGQYGCYSWTGVVWPERAQYDCEAHAVARAYRIAEEVLRGMHSDLYGNGYIWQAGFAQGYDVIECCGTYFGK